MITYPEIIFDAERMKYPDTGIFHYCKQLGDALLEQQHLHKLKLGFYLPSSVSDIFGKEAFQIVQKPIHKIFRPYINNHKIWHVTNQSTAYYPWGSRQKVVLTVHDLNFLYEKKSLAKQQAYLNKLQKKISQADAVIVISEFVKHEILNNLKIDSAKLRVIYNGCNISPDIQAQKPSGHVGLPYVFAIGAISPKKNFHVLPAAIVNNDLHLVIAGVIQDKQYFNKIFDGAKKLRVENRVHYIGSVSEPEKYWLLQNCSVFAFPSIAEGFGLPVIEAMRFGKPVLLSTLTSLPEIGGEIAYYFESFEPDDISKKANYALHDFTVEKAQQTIDWSFRFDWKKSAKQYWDVYERLSGS